jgi:hypothetical protein
MMANHMHAGHDLHADFGSLYAGHLNGIPFNVVGNSTPRKIVTFKPGHYESSPLPAEGLPIPDDAVYEGDPQPWVDGDHHLLLWDKDRGEAHEMYGLLLGEDGSIQVGQYSYFDLKTNLSQRPLGETSADASGMNMLAGLLTYDEAASGEIKHALRFTLENTAGYVWPATHQTSPPSDFPPFGTRVRLKAEIDAATYPGTGGAPTSTINRAIMQAAKDYGWVLADNGTDWFFSGVPDERWDNDELHLLVYFKPWMFEIVDNSALMISEDSAEARQF